MGSIATVATFSELLRLNMAEWESLFAERTRSYQILATNVDDSPSPGYQALGSAGTGSNIRKN
jgi:hypothetical protein